MPGVVPLAGARVLQGFPLQALLRQPDPAAVREQAFAIRGHQVRHGATKPDVAMEPEAAVHRVDHSIATPSELAWALVRRRVVRHRPTILHARYWQRS